MKNSVPILQTLRSGGKCQQGNSKMGNSSRASLLAGVTFCLLCILPFLSADRLCTEQSPSSRAFHHLMESDTESPPSLQEDSSHDACRGAPAPTWHPPCRLQRSARLVSCRPAASRAASPEPAKGPAQGAALRQCPRPSGQLGSHSGLCGPRTFPSEAWSCLGTKKVPSSHQGTGFTHFCHEPASTDPQGCALTPKVNSCFTSAFLFYSKGNFSTF